jgi:predicted transcriptional regulator
MAKKQLENADEKVPMIKIDEVRKLEHCAFRGQIISKDLDIAKIKREKLEKESALFSAQYTLKLKEIKELTEHINKLQKELTEFSIVHQEIKDEIGANHGLPKNWGYDPETLEIKV